MIVVIIVFDCIPALLIAMPLRDTDTLKKNTYYAVTDQRILVISKERYMSMLREEGLPIKVEKSGELSCVMFGTGVKVSSRGWRSLAIMGDDEEAKYKGLMFYQIPDSEAEKVRKLMNH